MMADPTTQTNQSIEVNNGPRRYIYNQADMEHFRQSPARQELLSFVSTMGRGLTGNEVHAHGGYHPHSPLEKLTPALASLHGSLSCMFTTWMDPNHGGIPPDLKVKARFGNPAFRNWHARLVERSYAIVRCLMDCHVKYSREEMEGLKKEEVLKECSDQGCRAASIEGPTLWPQQHDKMSVDSPNKEADVIAELRAYLHDSFGHPIRIDYGTGHESSFAVLLLSLCKIGCFCWGGTSNRDCNGGGKHLKSNPPPEVISLASLSLFHAYLNVTRELQRDYMLEPAGSHGVWGLDDYHCIPFYLGACQMMAREKWQRQNQQPKKKNTNNEVGTEQGSKNEPENEGANRKPDSPYIPETTIPVTDQSSPVDTCKDGHDHWAPSVIRSRRILDKHRPTYLYLSCINFIQEIKPKVPFFESSPMLNDISQLGSWSKVSSGLLRMYEGEVLNKMPVVQHFVFGKIFSANWTPSRKTPLEAPKRTFINGPMGEECIAPWSYGNGSGSPGGANQKHRPPPTDHPGGMPPTRAPWAK